MLIVFLHAKKLTGFYLRGRAIAIAAIEVGEPRRRFMEKPSCPTLVP
jgi:hypothetical protein